MSALIRGSQGLIVIVGPSGAGKDSIIRAWLTAQPVAQRPRHARRTITRPADPHEDHEVADPTEFRRALAAGEFALHWQAHGLDYGVRHAALAPLEQGHWVVLNGSREYLPSLRAMAPLARVVSIDAPDALRRQRLQNRAREEADARQGRLARHVATASSDLRLLNDGTLADAVAVLHRWFESLPTL